MDIWKLEKEEVQIGYCVVYNITLFGQHATKYNTQNHLIYGIFYFYPQNINHSVFLFDHFIIAT